MRASIYVRVSTKDQTCEMQLRELREYCQRRGWEIAGEYVDTGGSGSKTSRPQLDRIMRDAGEHRFDCVLVWKLELWGHSVSNLVASLQALQSLGIRWIATTQNLDTDENNLVGKLLLHILASVAEFERSMIQDRVKAGMSAAKHQGVSFGRPKVVFDRKRTLDLKTSGYSLREIGGILGVGRGTIERFLLSQNSNLD